jgi:hypothetical protein
VVSTAVAVAVIVPTIFLSVSSRSSIQFLRYLRLRRGEGRL